MVQKSLACYQRKLNPTIEKHFTEYRKTHNDGVFDAYTPAIRRARSAGLLTGLPDNYGRGRIIGDYRRIALYGTDFLKEEKARDLEDVYKRQTADKSVSNSSRYLFIASISPLAA